MSLRSIINEIVPIQSSLKNNKIVHQLNNQGCQCGLCQKIVVSQNQVIKIFPIIDIESECNMGKKESFWVPFLLDYFSMDKMSRKIKFLIPEICLFEKGVPTTLITKKKDHLPMKIIKNKEKMNAFEIQNFFTDGYISHNDVKNQKEGKYRSMSREQYYNYWDQLKNQCIVLAKFTNGTCQMMNMIELTNLFKSKQRQTRKQLSALVTLVNAQDHSQIRVPVEINPSNHTAMFERAKTEIKIINQDIKVKDFMYVTQKDERRYEEHLRERDVKSYLEYISMKLLLLYSIKTDVLIKSALFKYIKGLGNSFYLSDLQVYQKDRASCIWGDIRLQEPRRMATSPGKGQKRPTSSPERLQGALHSKLDKIEENREDRSVTFKLTKENDKIRSLMSGTQSRSRAYTGIKLEPVKNTKFFMRR